MGNREKLTDSDSIQLLPEKLQEQIKKEGVVTEDGNVLIFEALNLDVDPELITGIASYWFKQLKEEGLLDDKQPISVAVVESSADMLAFALSNKLTENGFRVDRIVRIRKGTPVTLRGELLKRLVHSVTRLQPITISTAKRFIPPGENFLIVDDFSASLDTLAQVESMIKEGGGKIIAACVTIDKPHQHSESFSQNIPLISVVKIEEMTPATENEPAIIKFAGMPKQSLLRR